MRIRLIQVDAFTDKIFGGNPAAVCPLERWLPDALLQSIATENNLSETAYFVPRGEDYELRWFTPVAEIDLAGHPTLATAWVMLNTLGVKRETLVFHTKIGDRLVVTREGDRLAMDFPSRPPAPRAIGDVAAALGAKPAEVLAARDGFAVFAREEDVRALKPDMGKVAALDCMALIVTAPGKDCDFVSRFFAPKHNIPEDPVTGSAHSTLIPYWAKRLGKSEMFARQVSKRGGALWCRHRGDRVTIAGQCAPYLDGWIEL
ncbi:MAG TPA: PhzF family phenazine biosynthesis protein [Alphaproteobacteria bacterium]|jgi:PhzF family phenazine biosynthesis protein